MTTAAVLVLTNVPLVMRNVTAWWYPYRFAQVRQDTKGTIWDVLPLHSRALGVASTLLLVALLAAIAVAVARNGMPFEHAATLAVVAFMVANKVWQPHYVIWLLPAAAFVARGRRWLRALEWSSLLWFWVLWRKNTPSTPVGVLAWPFGALRIGCLAGFAAAIALDARRRDRVGAALPRDVALPS